MYVGLKRGNISQGMYLGELKMFGEKKTWENVHYILVLKLYPDFEVIP